MPELKKLFARVVNQKKKEQGIRTKRSRPHKAEVWTVWGMMQTAERNRSRKVARNLFGVRGDPKTHRKAKNAVEQVNRAFQKAESLIQEVGNSRNNSITEEAAEAALVKGIRSIVQSFKGIHANTV